MAGPRVVLAMSGGVDSSASAVLLKRQGYDVVGLFMRTGVQSGHTDTRPDNKKGCCSAVDSADARRVADRLDIPFHALDFEAEFNQIIDYFAEEYLRGRTPNPCVVCNTWLKFGELWKFAQQLGAEFIATGHYARVLRNPAGEAELHVGRDSEKDQSYVLHGIQRAMLNKLLFPVGGHTKPEIRSIAREAGLLGVAEKPDSVEICFVPSGKHVDVVRSRRPDAQTAGEFITKEGTVLGTHDGIDRFTVGQRKGLGLGGGGKRFVLEVIPETHQVVLGDAEDLLATGLMASRINWLIDRPTERVSCEAKIRYKHAAVPAELLATADGGAELRFQQPQTAVTPGQAVTLYSGSRVLGGGWIESPIR
ncbi:MAG: tRNA 2-thiouridine(34) synthase MnmA [Gemmataceae bacterium]